MAEFSARVEYGVHPSYKELQKIKGLDVPKEYDGLVFNPIDACRGIPTGVRVAFFRLISYDVDATNDEILAYLDELGLRPAVYEEFYAVVREFAFTVYHTSFIALGSFVKFDDHLASPNISRVMLVDRPSLGLSLHNPPKFGGGAHFLAVRK